MSHNRLLAKSYDRNRFPAEPPDYALLVQHSRDVAGACRELAEILGPVLLDVSGLNNISPSLLSTTLRLNGWIQDLGKANSHFQMMVSSMPEIRQLVRHETISGMLVWLDPALRAWLGPLSDALVPAVWGAVGHHRKFDDHNEINQSGPIDVRVAHEDFRTILAEMSRDLGLTAPPHFDRDLKFGRNQRDDADRSVVPMFQEMVRDFAHRESAYEDAPSRRFVALVKGLGIAADVAASAVAKRGVSAAKYSVESFVKAQLATTLTPDDLSGLIRRWAWNRYTGTASLDASQSPPGFTVRPFQEQVERSGAFATLAEAGCGSGKSLAAYLWARAWCIRRQNTETSTFRLFFCLPTTGTTTEHFKDYALESGIPTDLVHSRAAVDLNTLAATVPQEELEGDLDPNGDANAPVSRQVGAARAALVAERDKLEALALWETRVAVTSADTVLGLMVNSRRGLCALPAILQSGIVFDEVHAFDDTLFGHLLVFLKTFTRLPVLLMTASMQDGRRRALLEVRPDLNIVPGPPDLETLPRYRIQTGTPEQAWTAVGHELGRGGKVLWVRNRVDWANRTYESARALFMDSHVDVYHSRLRYRDRSRRHRRVIDRFGSRGKSALLVATQVAEMSLDLSADLLVTDEAPVPSMIQRLGRLNRRATPALPGTPKVAVVQDVPSGDELPYSVADLSMARAWRSTLLAHGRPVSQRDLSDSFLSFGEKDTASYDVPAAEERACFIGLAGRTGVWRTRPGSTRTEGYTVTVVLADDLERFRHSSGPSSDPSSTWLRENEVSIPMKDEVISWSRVAGRPVAPSNRVSYDYDESNQEGTGARWRRS